MFSSIARIVCCVAASSGRLFSDLFCVLLYYSRCLQDGQGHHQGRLRQLFPTRHPRPARQHHGAFHSLASVFFVHSLVDSINIRMLLLMLRFRFSVERFAHRFVFAMVPSLSCPFVL